MIVAFETPIIQDTDDFQLTCFALKQAKDIAIECNELIYLFSSHGYLRVSNYYPVGDGVKILAKCYPGGRTELKKEFPKEVK